tara:strand:- start:662 stop:1183 length:522 start_codon:yes stop_codon:yes gene_type:complete
MASWGNSDSLASGGTITIGTAGVCTGSGTTFSTAGVTGGVISVGAGATYGEAIIVSVDSNTKCTVASTEFLIYDPTTGLIPTGTAYFVSGKPKSLLTDSNYSSTEVYGVDTTEQGVANAASGDARKYAPPHAGWVGIQTYIDTHGTLRVKTETLVAMSSIDSDASDDTKFPDS